MTTIGDILHHGRRVAAHHPVPRVVVDAAGWEAAAFLAADGRAVLLSLWAERDQVHMALLAGDPAEIAVVSLACPEGAFPSVGQHHPPAIRLERAIHDLYGLEPRNAEDARPWLDHGRWQVRKPLGEAAADRGAGDAYAFLPVEGEGLHQIPVGPVHAGIIEPGLFRFTANGETVARLEQRLGYVHKGVDGLMQGADLGRAARLAGRVSGDSTVAYSIAFAQAIEAASGVEAPRRAQWLRALMLELERIANHLGDIGAICNDASFAIMLAHCGILRERVLRAAAAAFGHRLMMDRVVPGGVAADLAAEGVAALRAALSEITARFPALVALYDNTTSLQDRTVGTGSLSPTLARQFGAGGYVGRASGRAFDARGLASPLPYATLGFQPALRSEGDVNARVWVRIDEVTQSLALIGRLLDGLPAGEIAVALPATDAPVAGPREGMALVEGFRGDVLAWVRLGADGRVARCHLRDPSWFQWPLLEAAIEGNIVADFPLCNKSFNCSYSGHDL
ncbi:MAG TPA: NADH-quinone oxidoreductase subunit C [Alphaproteobacteria bacterium]|nr:NADH-quinone oxidoreductase subunit C [Alphaproteobacteria bacterium]